MRRIVVYGAGGHGKVVADVLQVRNETVIGFVDDGLQAGTMVMSLAVLGGGDWLRDNEDVALALGIGSNAARQGIAERYSHLIVSAIHPAAAVSRTARVGPGAVVMANAVVNPDAVVGVGAIVNSGGVIEHDCVVDEFAHVSPNATLGGGARLGRRSHLGLGAVVLPGIRVGSDTVVGAGAVVARDLPDGVVAMGVPARIRR